MNASDYAVFRVMVQRAIIHRRNKPLDETNKYFIDAVFMLVHGERISYTTAKEKVFKEARCQQLALEEKYQSCCHLAIAAYFENGYNHEAPDVEIAIPPAKAAGKILGKDGQDVECEIAESCLDETR